MMRNCGLLTCIWLGVVAAPQLPAADDTQQFIDALRGRRQYDLALEFLDTVPNSGIASDEFKASLPYQRGSVLADKSRVEANSTTRLRIVEQARSQLKQFADANGQTAEGANAYLELGLLERENGLLAVMKSKDLPAGSSDRAALWNTARDDFDAARSTLEKAEEAYTYVLGQMPKSIPQSEKALYARRLDLRSRLSQARLFAARLLHDKASAYVKGAKDAVSLEEQAIAELQDLSDKYGTFTVGFQAQLFQGESYLALGKVKEAIGSFEYVIAPGEGAPELRELVTAAHSFQAEAYNAEKNYDTVLGKNALWLNKARGDEAQSPAWLRLRYQVAEAARLKAEDPETTASDRRKLLVQARDHYRSAARYPNEFQSEARLTLSNLVADGESLDPTNFADAYLAGKDAVSLMTTAQSSIDAARQNNPEGVADLERQAAESFDEAVRNLELATRLVDDDTEIAKLNEVRYLLSWLNWQRENYYQSAVMAEFLARRHSSDPVAESAAKVALASHEQLYARASEAGGGEFEARQLNDMAGYVTRRWPTSQTAELAFGVILNFALKENRFAEAKDQIAQLDDARRPLFEARLGTAMWEAQLRAADSDEPATFDVQVVRGEAKRLLEASVEPLASDPTAGSTLAGASLRLSQAYLQDAEYDKAITLLEDDRVGALRLIETSNPVASRPAFKLEALRTALRAYVSATPPQIDKATGMMGQLEAAANDAGGGDMLTNTYVAIGLQLKQQIDELNKDANIEEASRVTAAFGTFLAKIREGGDSLSFPIRQWIAQTYFNLGEATLDPQQRSDYFAAARDEFQTLLDAVTENPEVAANPNTKLALQLQLGNSLRELREFATAYAMFETILAEREMLLDIQKAAAYTLQEWGSNLGGGDEQLEQALYGGPQKNDKGKSVVWGWIRLQQIAAAAARQQPQWKDLFFESWVNIARTRYLLAMAATGDTQRERLKRAKTVIRTFYGSYNELGGPERRAEFDYLLKQIQRAGGEKPIGLEEITGKKEPTVSVTSRG
jgi:hypothetical protein